MEINVTAKDYFRELKLMEQQYGQEEDLYPWIYMLLQMAECKKIENFEEGNIKNYQPVSMRFVASAGKADAEVVGRELIKGVAGFPDIAILDTSFEVKRKEELKNEKNRRIGRIIINGRLILESCMVVLKLRVLIRIS